MKLITETIEDVQILTEETNGKKDYKIRGVFMQADIKNRNGRIYPVETLVTKMDASALNFMTEDAERVLAKIYWSVNTTNGKSGVELLWAGSGTSSANATIGFFSGRGFHDYFKDGNSIPNNSTLTANTSPAGDILLSTKGFVAGDNYTLILEVR